MYAIRSYYEKIVANGKSEIGVYFIKGGWYAYQNHCPHQGGALEAV